MEGREHIDVLDLFRNNSLLKVCAPMVRYSKLEFRALVKKYGCQLCFTPMIIADSFVQSLKARNNEFTTNKEDKPLIVQFAAKNVDDFVQASELVSPFCDGVDLNCGCPQRWAMSDGYGAELLSKPQLIKDMVRRVRNVSPNKFSVSVKMRLLNDIRETIELCRALEAAGVTFLTVHGRMVTERCEPVHYAELKALVQSLDIPIVANGDIKSLADALQMKDLTDCNGVMAARGILQNPALYSGSEVTPLSCIQDWVDLSLSSQVQFHCFHHHLVFMLEKVLPKRLRRDFNNLKTVEKVTNFLQENLGINASVFEREGNAIIEYNDQKDGSYFRSKILEDSEDDIEEYIGDFCATLNNSVM